MLAAIETTGDTCGVALFADNMLRAELHVELPRAHDRLLAHLFATALEIAGATARDVERYAVSIGPGSFTGIRIGMAFAIGAAMARGAELIAVPTLDAVAFNVGVLGQRGVRSRVLALVPAGRDGLYAGLYEVSPEFRRLTEYRAMPPANVPSLLDETVVAAGPGVLALEASCHDRIVTESHRLTARAVGRYGLHQYYHGITTTPAEIRPLYISDFTPLAARASVPGAVR